MAEQRKLRRGGGRAWGRPSRGSPAGRSAVSDFASSVGLVVGQDRSGWWQHTDAMAVRGCARQPSPTGGGLPPGGVRGHYAGAARGTPP
jgi:hypothetical protein